MVLIIFLILSLSFPPLSAREENATRVLEDRARRCINELKIKQEVYPQCIPILQMILFSTFYEEKDGAPEKLRKRAVECSELLRKRRMINMDCLSLLKERIRHLENEARKMRLYEKEVKRRLKEAEEIGYRLLDGAVLKVGNRLVSYLSLEIPFGRAQVVEWSGPEDLWFCVFKKRINLYKPLKGEDPTVEAVLYLADKEVPPVADPSALPPRFYKLKVREKPEEKRNFVIKVSQEGNTTRISLPAEVFGIRGGLYLGADEPLSERICESRTFTTGKTLDIIKVEVIPGVSITADIAGLLTGDLKLEREETR